MRAAALLALLLATAAQAQDADTLYAQGVEARLAGRFETATELMGQVLALTPGNADALVQLGFARLGAGDLSGAGAAFERALALAPDYTDARFGLAQIEFRRGHLDRALAMAQPLAREQPENGEIAALVANLRKARTAGDAARQAPRRPDPLAVLLKQARAQRDAGHLADAGRSYRRALDLSPRDADILTALGLIAAYQQNYPEAARHFDAALALRPDHLDARLGVARLALWQGDIAAARSRVNGALALAPDNPEALLLDGRIALLERDYPRAGRAFETLTARDPQNAGALTGLGDLRRAEGDDAGARLAYRRALALSPGNPEIRARLAAPPPRRWRLDVQTQRSDLSAGFGSWTDGDLRLTYRPSPQTTLGGALRRATRHGQTDLQVEGRVDHAISPALSVYGLLAATPDADFLPRASVGTGLVWRALPEQGGAGPVNFSLDLRYDRFAGADIVTLSPGLQGFALHGRLGLSAHWVHSRDDRGTASDGYILRADAAFTPRFSAFAGYADAPEIEAGALTDTRTSFAGAAFALDDDLTLRAHLAHERRPRLTRDSFGLGLSVRF